MGSRTDALDNIQSYANKIQDESYVSPDGNSLAQEARLEKTINDLNARIQKERNALEELKSRAMGRDILNEYHEDVPARIRQLQVLTKAYESITSKEPQMPTTNSALPALLALRTTDRLVKESTSSIRETHSQLTTIRNRLSREQSDLHDAEILKQLLEDRIESLKEATASKAKQSPDEAAKALVAAEDTRRQTYDRGTKQMMRRLIRFINNTLGPMLAAEELGGPVAGSLLDISDELLAAGFNAQGKAKRSKAPVNNDKRQKRIDQIWGTVRDGEGDAQFDDTTRSEAQEAAEEMKSLVDSLLNTLAEEGSGSWVTLERESAASRFLIRSGIALLHRTNAKRIRLVDFGREIDE